MSRGGDQEGSGVGGVQFGGSWTDTKLSVLADYLRSYTTALRQKPSKENPFRKAFVDAFAGTGYRETQQDSGRGSGEGLLFPDLAEEEPQALLDGSARLALQVEPPFDRYIFIEHRADRCKDLERLKSEFPSRDIDVQQGEANERIQELCGVDKDWSSHRAVMFLDPFGMQVEWATVQAIAQTQAIDLWILFPLGVGVNRLLKKSGDIPQSWRRRLDRLLGTTDWYDEFYKVEAAPTLFGGEEERVIKASQETIGRYFISRLESIFAGVAPEPAVLRNSRNCPLYLLCFAVGNPRGKEIALRIANHILGRVAS